MLAHICGGRPLLLPGKLADIVLLDTNPLDDIANTLSTWRVASGGWVFAEPQPLTIPNEEGHNAAEVDEVH